MKTRILLLITMLCAAMATVQSVYAAGFTVTNTGDNGGVNPAPNAGTGTLRQAIVDANANAGVADTINFSPGVTGTILLVSALPNLADDVTISGPGANVLAVKRDPAAATNFRIFTIDSGKTVAISGLTITNGVAGGQNAPDSAGGGIYNGGTLTVSNCTFSGNTASQIGGGIFNGPDPLTVSNCTFSGNSASVFGGGIYIQSAGLVMVSNSTFSSNSASVFGGGIFKRGGGAGLTVSNSTFSSNSAGTGGGAIFNDSPGAISSATVSNSTFSGNSASNHGGGISNESGGGLTVSNSTFSGNSATVNGGGIYNGGGLTIRSTILNTGAPQNIYKVGGVVTSGGYNLSSDDASALLNQTTDQNSTDPMLGPLQNNGGPTVTFGLLPGSPAIDKGKNFTALTTDQRGTGFPRTIDDGAVSNASGGDGTDIGAFESNFFVVTKTADTNDGTCDSDCSLREAITAANSIGGAPIIQFDIPTMDPGYDPANDRYTITLNSLGALPNLNSDITIDGLGANHLTVKRDSAAANFRIFTVNSGKTVTISGLTITNGNVTGDPAFGGGIYNAGTLTVANCAISGNSAPGGHLGSESDGGGIYNANFSTLTVTNCAISSNSVRGDALGAGGGIYNGVGSVTTITNSTISGNSATDGGGIYNVGGNSLSDSPTTMLTVTNSTISGNSVSDSGGGILNAASNGSATHGSATVLITNSTISGNSASSSGGGIENDLFGPTGNGNATVTIGDTVLNAGAEGANINNISGTIVSLGYNLSSDAAGGDGTTAPGGFLNSTGDQRNTDPMLGPLQDNGGPTFTHELLCGSPAIDKGKNFAGATTDQRGAGFARTFDDPDVANASGGDGSDIGAFEVQDICNRPPVAVDNSYSTDEDTPLTVNAPGVLGNDSDPDNGDSITAVLVSGPSHSASFSLNSDGSFSYTPASNYNGGDSFTYKAVDSHNAESNVATVNITINAVNDPPSITGGTVSRAQNGGSSNSPIATVSDVDNSAGSLTVTVQSAPTGITVTNIVNTNGTITADVAAGCSAATGSNTVVLQVSDGDKSSTGNLTVNVTANTTAPVITLKAAAVIQQATNHGYHTFSIAQMVQSATDDCGGNVINNVVIEKATSDEVEDAPGGGDGNTRNDIVIAGNCKSVQLRAERDGGLNGRVYLVTLRVSDGQNIARATYRVSVPVGNNPAVDSGVHYTVNGTCP